MSYFDQPCWCSNTTQVNSRHESTASFLAPDGTLTMGYCQHADGTVCHQPVAYLPTKRTRRHGKSAFDLYERR